MKKLALLLIIPALAAGCGNDKPTQAEQINSDIHAFNCSMGLTTLGLELLAGDPRGHAARDRAKLESQGCKIPQEYK